MFQPSFQWPPEFMAEKSEDGSLVRRVSSSKARLSPSQLRVQHVVEGHAVNIFMTLVILGNAAQVCYESDISSACTFQHDKKACDEEDGWLKWMNWVYLVIYSVELGLRVYVHRIGCFGRGWDVFDGSVIGIGLLSEALGGLLPSPGILRIARLARLSRAGRVVKLPHELHVMVHGLASASKAIGMGAFAVFVLLGLWAIVAIELLNPLNHDPDLVAFYKEEGCSRCPRAWSSIWEATFSFTQLMIMGESWDVLGIPMIERNPATLLIFVGVFFSVVMGMSNLILAVIVERALSKQQDDLKKEAHEKEKRRGDAVSQFVKMCSSMDLDGDGTLDIVELKTGFDKNPQFREILHMMDITQTELEVLFHIMDRDASGSVSYEEFGEELASVKNACLPTTVSFTKYHVLQLKIMVEQLAASLMSKESYSKLLDKASVNTHGIHFDRTDEEIKEQFGEVAEIAAWNTTGEVPKAQTQQNSQKSASSISAADTPHAQRAEAAKLRLPEGIEKEPKLQEGSLGPTLPSDSAARTCHGLGGAAASFEALEKELGRIPTGGADVEEWLRCLDRRAAEIHEEAQSAVKSSMQTSSLVAALRTIVLKLGDQTNQYGQKRGAEADSRTGYPDTAAGGKLCATFYDL